MRHKQKPMKEGIFQLTGSNVVNDRVIGRDEFGDEIIERIPPVRSEMMMDKGGNYSWVGLSCHRVTTDFSYEKYGAQNRLETIKNGYFPVQECPHTMKYADVMKGPLAEPVVNQDKKGKEIVEPPCPGAVEYEGDPYSDEAKKLHVVRALNETSFYFEVNVIPCKHFLELRERLLGRNAERVAVREAMMAHAPAESVNNLAKQIAQIAKTGGDVVQAEVQKHRKGARDG